MERPPLTVEHILELSPTIECFPTPAESATIECSLNSKGPFVPLQLLPLQSPIRKRKYRHFTSEEKRSLVRDLLMHVPSVMHSDEEFETATKKPIRWPPTDSDRALDSTDMLYHLTHSLLTFFEKTTILPEYQIVKGNKRRFGKTCRKLQTTEFASCLLIGHGTWAQIPEFCTWREGDDMLAAESPSIEDELMSRGKRRRVRVSLPRTELL